MTSSACFFYAYTKGFFLSGVIFLLLSQDIRIRTFKSGYGLLLNPGPYLMPPKNSGFQSP